MKRILILTFLLILTLASNIYSSQGKIFEGYCSWYGERFHGRKTASGEIYDMHKMTAAHRTLPFGTYVQITNTENNRSVVARVNDRGPFKKNRVIDVSKAAAAKLNFIKQGLTRVRVKVLGKYYDSAVNSAKEKNYHVSETDYKEPFNSNEYSGSVQPEKIPDLNPEKKQKKLERKEKGPLRLYIIKAQEAVKKSKKKLYKIQFGAYTNLEIAIIQQRKMKKKGIDTLLCLYRGNGKLFRLLSKKTYKKEQEAKEARTRIEERGIKGFVLEL